MQPFVHRLRHSVSTTGDPAATLLLSTADGAIGWLATTPGGLIALLRPAVSAGSTIQHGPWLKQAAELLERERMADGFGGCWAVLHATRDRHQLSAEPEFELAVLLHAMAGHDQQAQPGHPATALSGLLDLLERQQPAADAGGGDERAQRWGWPLVDSRRLLGWPLASAIRFVGWVAGRLELSPHDTPSTARRLQRLFDWLVDDLRVLSADDPAAVEGGGEREACCGLCARLAGAAASLVAPLRRACEAAGGHCATGLWGSLCSVLIQSSPAARGGVRQTATVVAARGSLARLRCAVARQMAEMVGALGGAMASRRRGGAPGAPAGPGLELLLVGGEDATWCGDRAGGVAARSWEMLTAISEAAMHEAEVDTEAAAAAACPLGQVAQAVVALAAEHALGVTGDDTEGDAEGGRSAVEGRLALDFWRRRAVTVLLAAAEQGTAEEWRLPAMERLASEAAAGLSAVCGLESVVRVLFEPATVSEVGAEDLEAGGEPAAAAGAMAGAMAGAVQQDLAADPNWHLELGSRLLAHCSRRLTAAVAAMQQRQPQQQLRPSNDGPGSAVPAAVLQGTTAAEVLWAVANTAAGLGAVLPAVGVDAAGQLARLLQLPVRQLGGAGAGEAEDLPVYTVLLHGATHLPAAAARRVSLGGGGRTDVEPSGVGSAAAAAAAAVATAGLRLSRECGGALLQVGRLVGPQVLLFRKSMEQSPPRPAPKRGSKKKKAKVAPARPARGERLWLLARRWLSWVLTSHELCIRQAVRRPYNRPVDLLPACHCPCAAPLPGHGGSLAV